MKYILKYEVDKQDIKNDLLKKKGILDPVKYINVDKTSENESLLLNNMQKGCDLLISHLNKGNKIYIQPDSDLDGYMSSAMLYNYIKLVWPDSDISWHMHEGKQHGIILDYVPEDVYLAIFPDSATNNIVEQKRLKERGIDVLILDHHEISFNITDAVLINNQEYDKENRCYFYPNQNLSGGGIVYKFIQQLDKILNVQYSEQFIDMAAISIVGDMMDLRDYENRYIVRKGLKNIKNLALKQLIEKQAYSIGDITKLTPISIAFYIVPLVNALVRVGTQTEKEMLWMAFTNGHKIVPSTKRGHKGEVEGLAEQAVRNCVNARARQNRLKDKAIEELDIKIQKNELFRNQLIFVNVEDDELFDGTLTGLIAMNFLSKYKKPTIVARLNDDGFWQGSARGSNSTELKDLKAFFVESKLFEFAEGHANAFGISINSNNVERLVDYANDKLKNVEFNENTYEVDLVYNSKNNFEKAIDEISQLKTIWGQGIEEPLIVVEDIKLFPEDVSFIGENKDTVKFTTDNGVSFLKFKDSGLVSKIKGMKSSFSITVLGKANMNEWGGNFSPQIMIEDYTIKNTQYDF